MNKTLQKKKKQARRGHISKSKETSKKENTTGKNIFEIAH